MKRLLALVLLAGMLIPLPTAHAQLGADVAVGALVITPAPVVGAASLALVNFTAAGATTVVVTFTWGDGAGLENEDTAGGQGYTIVRPIPSAGEYNMSLSFEPEAGRRGPQQVVVTLQANGDTNDTNDRAVNDTFVRDPKLAADFLNETVADRLPDATTLLRYNVSNQGNWPDQPILRLPEVEGWRLRLLGTLPVIPPGGNASGVVLATPVSTNVNLSLNETRVEIVSSLREAINASPLLPFVRPNISALGASGLVVVAPAGRIQVAPGESAPLNVTVRNDGPVPTVAWTSASFPVNATGWAVAMEVPQGWPSDFETPALVNGTLPLPLLPGESRNATVRVTRNLTGSNLSANVLVRAAPGVADKSPLALPNATATMTLVDAAPDLAMRAIDVPRLLYQGDAADVRFTVVDAGRLPTFNATLQVELRDNLRTVTSREFAVPALEPNGTATFTWRVLTDALRGDYAVSARVVPNATQAEVGGENDGMSSTMRVRRASVGLDGPTTIRALPGERLTLRTAIEGVSVANRGDDPERIHVDLSSAHAWLNASWDVSLAAGERQALPLELEVPARPGFTETTATLRAHLVNRTSAFGTLDVRLVIVDETPPTATLLPPAEGRVGTPSVLEAEAQDATGVRSVVVVARLPTGERQTIPLLPAEGSETRFRGTFTPKLPGNYTLQVRAEDDSPSANQLLGPNVTWRVGGVAFAGLVPSGFAEGSSVGTRNLTFREAADGTVASATVDFGAGALPLAFPYVATLPAKEGPYTILVRATSLLGQTAEGTWNVTLDLTPPVLANATAEPTANGLIAASVEARGASNVTLRLVGANGPVETPLARQEGSRYTATVPAPAGFQKAIFLARDEAGNPASLEAPAATKGTPGFAAGFALVAVALAMLLARRR